MESQASAIATVAQALEEIAQTLGAGQSIIPTPQALPTPRVPEEPLVMQFPVEVKPATAEPPKDTPLDGASLLMKASNSAQASRDRVVQAQQTSSDSYEPTGKNCLDRAPAAISHFADCKHRRPP